MSLPIVLVLFFGLIALGVPIAFTMIALSLSYFALSPTPYLIALVPQKMFEGIDSTVLTAIPFFLLAGELMNTSGIVERLARFAEVLVGRIRGGLAQMNILASLLFSGLTGVAVGDIAALGKVEVGMMETHGYSRAYATAVTISSCLVGAIIPPSTIIILYCAIMNVSVGAMFLAALIPGLVMAVADMALVGVQARTRDFPRYDAPVSRHDIVAGARDAAFAILMPILLIGGIVGGITTPTEGSAAAVLYAIVVGALIYRKLTLRQFFRSLVNTSFDTARLLFMIGAALTLTWIFALEDLSGATTAILSSIDVPGWVMLLVINLLFLVLGMFMDAALILILFGPVVAPFALELGVDPLQLGIMLIMNVTLGLATPPVGNVLFAICAIIKVDMGALIRELLPFLFFKFVVIMTVALVPALTLTLPRAFGF
jgi:tripartite ATP-independent transporter DctM subunit